MRRQSITSKTEEPQYCSPVSRDLEGLSHELMGLSTEVTEPQWARLRLIIMQLRSIAGQVDGLVIPNKVEA